MIYDISEIQRRLEPVFREYRVKSAVLFGSYSIGKAFAASVKRLRIHFKKEYFWYFPTLIYPLISPVREQEFLETLKTINPNIQIRINDKKDWWRIWDWDI